MPNRYKPCCYGYLRVSHVKSYDSGISLEVQRKQIIAFHEMNLGNVRWGKNGWKGSDRRGKETDDAMFTDGAQSAFHKNIMERPAGGRLHDAIREGDHIIAAKQDRLFRSSYDLHRMMDIYRRRGINVHVIDTGYNLGNLSPHNELLAAVTGALARHESALKSQRALEVADNLRATGRPRNQKGRLGYRVVEIDGIKRLERDEEEMTILGEIISANLEWGLGAASIMLGIEGWLAREEHRAPNPGPIMPSGWSFNRINNTIRYGMDREDIPRIPAGQIRWTNFVDWAEYRLKAFTQREEARERGLVKASQRARRKQLKRKPKKWRKAYNKNRCQGKSKRL